MSSKIQDRIELIFNLMEYDSLTDAEHSLVLSFSNRWTIKKYLSERQIKVLEDIFKQASER